MEPLALLLAPNPHPKQPEPLARENWSRRRTAHVFHRLRAFTLAALTGTALPGFAETLERFVFAESHMGTWVRLTIYAPKQPQAEGAAKAAFARFEELNSIMSDYDPASELMRLVQSPVGLPVKVSHDLFNVLRKAEEFAELTHGAFDVTSGPLVQLWREARTTATLPDPTSITQAMQSVGYGNLQLNGAHQTATLLTPNMRLDLGGIAKGYAADEALAILHDHGCPQSLVAVSGDLRLGDAPPEKDGWRVGIESIDATRSHLTATATLANRALSTSGDTEQFVELEGKRYSHILDPRTGVGLTRRIGVTVLAPDAITADALATAVSILGAETGIGLIEKLAEVEALVVIRTVTGYETMASSGFPRD